MDINKRKQFEAEFSKTDYFDIEYRAKGISKPFSWNDRANRYVWHDIQAGWEMWEKAQAVPEGFALVSQKDLLELTIAINAVDLATHTESKTNEVREMWQDIALKLMALGISQEPTND